MKTLLDLVKKLARILFYPFYLLACWIASRQPEPTPSFLYDAGEYRITGRTQGEVPITRWEVVDNPAHWGYVICNLSAYYDPWRIDIVINRDELLRSSLITNLPWDTRRFVSIDEFQQALDAGAHIKYDDDQAIVVVTRGTRGNRRKWRLHQLQQSWEEHLQVRNARHQQRFERKLARIA